MASSLASSASTDAIGIIIGIDAIIGQLRWHHWPAGKECAPMASSASFAGIGIIIGIDAIIIGIIIGQHRWHRHHHRPAE